MSSSTFPRQTGSLSRQIVLRILLLSSIILLSSITGAVSTVSNRLQNVRGQLDTKGSQAVRTFDEFLGNIGSDLHTIGDTVTTVSDVNEAFRRTLHRQPSIFELVLVDPQGQILAQRRRVGGAAADSTLTEQPWLATVQAHEIYFGPVDSSEYGVPFIDMAAAVTDERDRLVATLLARVDLTTLWEAAINLEVGKSGYVYITDEAGQLLAYRDLQLVRSGAMLKDLVGRTPQAIAASNINLYTGLNDESVIASSVPLHSVPWFAVVEQPVSEALRSLVWPAVILSILLLVLVLLIFNVVLFTQRGIVSRLAKLRQGVDILSQGDLAHRIDLETEDELGALANAFNSMASQLQETVSTLERRVAERTRDLEHRSLQLEAAAQVSHEAAAIQDVGQLLNTTVHLISDRFGFYHAGIFLRDETGEHVVLSAASSEHGQQMLARGHRSRIGGIGIVAYAARVGTPRIALDVGADVVYFDNPDLPLTRSEIALPLKVQERTIGVLDVHSTEAGAFSEADVAALQVLADQVAMAIENTRLLEESRRALQELEALHGQRVREDWQEQQSRRLAAYRYTQAGVVPASSSPAPETEPLPFHGRPLFQQDGDNRRLIAPIRLRKEAFGSIVLNQDPEQEPWSPEELAIVEEVSNQVALALENARLLETTQRRATQERLIGEITANIRESLDLDVVLQTAVREMGEALDIAEVQVRMWTSEASDETGE